MILQSSCYQQNLVNYNWLVAVSAHRFRGMIPALMYNIRYCTFLSQSGGKYFFVLEINIVYYLQCFCSLLSSYDDFLVKLFVYSQKYDNVGTNGCIL